LVVKIGQEGIGITEGRDPTCGNICTGLLLLRLPSSGPEPGFLGRNRHLGKQFNHAIGTLHHSELSTWFVQAVSAPNLWRKNDRPPLLDGDVAIHVRSITVLLSLDQAVVFCPAYDGLGNRFERSFARMFGAASWGTPA